MDRLEKKKILLENKGGVCYVCGEERSKVLQMHHLDPSTKDRNIKDIYSMSLERLVEESEKCVILCSNCHILIHQKDPVSVYTLHIVLNEKF